MVNGQRFSCAPWSIRPTGFPLPLIPSFLSLSHHERVLGQLLPSSFEHSLITLPVLVDKSLFSCIAIALVGSVSAL